jgi:predicted RNA binding protein YcfA (HicA-like mRNA interferase family)
MPKFPHVSGAQAIRVLERLGFVVARQNGSHIVMRKGSVGCVVPNHKEVKIGTLAGVLRQAGVSADEFLRMLQN